MSSETPWVDADLDKLQRDTFGYVLHETNPANGLVVDKTAEEWPASIAATGLAVAAYPVGVERGFISRSAAVERPLATLRFFWNRRQGLEPIDGGAAEAVLAECVAEGVDDDTLAAGLRKNGTDANSRKELALRIASKRGFS